MQFYFSRTTYARQVSKHYLIILFFFYFFFIT